MRQTFHGRLLEMALERINTEHALTDACDDCMRVFVEHFIGPAHKMLAAEPDEMRRFIRDGGQIPPDEIDAMSDDQIVAIAQHAALAGLVHTGIAIGLEAAAIAAKLPEPPPTKGPVLN